MNVTLTKHCAFALLALAWAGTVAAQAQPAQPDGIKSAEAAAGVRLEDFAWLAGCWQGEVNRRQFREHWMPQRGGLMIGTSHTVSRNETTSYEFLRIEQRVDGVHYVAMPPGVSESAFKFDKASWDGPATTFTFVNPALEFPRQISYRKDGGGWLYATVAGKVRGVDKETIYPMRRIDCETGDFINP